MENNNNVNRELLQNLNLLSKHYYDIGQYRNDVWNCLKHFANLLYKKTYTSISKQEIREGVEELLNTLDVLEEYWAFPGTPLVRTLKAMYVRKEYRTFSNVVSDLVRSMISKSYRKAPSITKEIVLRSPKSEILRQRKDLHYFEILIAGNVTSAEKYEIRRRLEAVQSKDDKFAYDVVFATSFQDAMMAIVCNPNIQSCVIRYGVGFGSDNARKKDIAPFFSRISKLRYEDKTETELGFVLANVIRQYRPEIDLFYATDLSLDKIPTKLLQIFKRIFYRQEDVQELHLSILQGIQDRFDTPFFNALVNYSRRPTGVFHAMPVSRGNSVFNSNWIQDLGEFYGRNLYMAETSATTGGLDSLLQPTGPLKKAQELAAKAFGAKYSFFVTNGTSTANKIVVQALIQPGDIILIDRDCHKSHHYGLVLSGAYPVYLDSYPVEKYSMYGGVPLEEIKERLWELKAVGRLDKVKLLLLTNCTFDGIVYNVERVMEEILAIKPDMVFLWDEAWFGFAGFSYAYRLRTGMYCAEKLFQRYKSEEYREKYQKHLKECADKNEHSRMPDPDKVKIRVYATQSTHKTLTSLRQGSMIHIYDEEYGRKVENTFHEAYMTHTSTSPNYQILASLDVGRRQAELEGYELVEKSMQMAMFLRERIANEPLLSKYFSIVTTQDFIPEKYRESGFSQYYHPEKGWGNMDDAWEKDIFVLDPTKINLYIGKTGIDGDTFKREYLMNQFGIQVNKTTRNTVLFMTNIGTTRSSVAYLISVLFKIAKDIDLKLRLLNEAEMQQFDKSVRSLTLDLPPLPNFSYFHQAFRPDPNSPEGDMRTAYFIAYNEDMCEYLTIEACEKAISEGRELVSTGFVTPYPPGFPVLVPGQVLTTEILDFMKALDVKEVHNYKPQLGFRIFKEIAFEKMQGKDMPRPASHSGSHLSEKRSKPMDKPLSEEESKIVKE